MTAFVITSIVLYAIAALCSLLLLGFKQSWTYVCTVLIQGGMFIWGLFLLLR